MAKRRVVASSDGIRQSCCIRLHASEGTYRGASLPCKYAHDIERFLRLNDATWIGRKDGSDWFRIRLTERRTLGDVRRYMENSRIDSTAGPYWEAWGNELACVGSGVISPGKRGSLHRERVKERESLNDWDRLLLTLFGQSSVIPPCVLSQKPIPTDLDDSMVTRFLALLPKFTNLGKLHNWAMRQGTESQLAMVERWIAGERDWSRGIDRDYMGREPKTTKPTFGGADKPAKWHGEASVGFQTDDRACLPCWLVYGSPGCEYMPEWTNGGGI